MWLIITCTLVTTLYATTITIANVSLLQIQGALSASPDQVAWVVTANLIATAVTIPLAGWFSNRFGRKRCMIWGTVGFGFATLMCGLSNSLAELVFWRVLQSAFGSPLTPISQSVVIDEFTGERRGFATAIYSMGVSVTPTIAPLAGGYISEEISWRWVFFILLPIAFIALICVLAFIKPDPPREDRQKLDWTGFISLAIAVSCVQLMLDRGEREDWFESLEIIVEAAGAVIFGWIFLVHSLTSERPFLDPRLLLERNFALGVGITLVFGMLFVTPMVLMPAMMQQLRGIPELTAGLFIGARGLGTMLSQVFMIAFAHRWDPRLLFMIGFGLQTYAALVMLQFDMNVSLGEIAWLMIIQGFGVGCIWVPMTLVTFSNFDPRRTADGSAISAGELTGALTMEDAQSISLLGSDFASFLEGLGDGTPEEAAVRHSYPDWIARLWWAELGAADARALMAAGNEPPERAFRIIRRRADAAGVLAALGAGAHAADDRNARPPRPHGVAVAGGPIGTVTMSPCTLASPLEMSCDSGVRPLPVSTKPSHALLRRATYWPSSHTNSLWLMPSGSESSGA